MTQDVQTQLHHSFQRCNVVSILFNLKTNPVLIFTKPRVYYARKKTQGKQVLKSVCMLISSYPDHVGKPNHPRLSAHKFWTNSLQAVKDLCKSFAHLEISRISLPSQLKNHSQRTLIPVSALNL